MRFSRQVFAPLIAMTLFAGTSEAADLRVRGEITALDDGVATVTTSGGEAVPVTLTEPVVLLYQDIPLEDVGEGAYVAVPSVANADGTYQALGLVVFPNEMRGMNEGFKPWDLTAESKMTNATVAKIVANSGDRVLTVTYGDEEQTIVVPEEAQVSTFAPNPDMPVEVGQNVVIFADDSSGEITGKFVGVHENGRLPPV